MDSKKSPKVANIFSCKFCNYSTSKKSDYTKHLSTDKHKNIENGSKMAENDSKKSQKVAKNYTCNCGRNYKYDSGYYRHKKICTANIENYEDNEIVEDKYLKDETDVNNIMNSGVFFELIKQNQEFQKLIVEQNKQIFELAAKNTITNNTINDNSKTINNKSFNLNFFLNEKCKDALNITEFIDSLKISLTDLENLGENGFVDGVSQIFVNGLKNLDVYKRPIHCSDLKRETMYLKQQNVWEKDNENKDMFKKAVKMIAHKNMLRVKDWKEKYPEYKDGSSKRNDQYLKILMGAALPYKKEEEECSYNKIIKNIAKEVTIDKQW